MHAIQGKRSDGRTNGVHDDRPVLITGGSGFVGANLAQWLLDAGRDVVLYDNLSRAGVADNARALRDRYGGRVQLVVGDIRDKRTVGQLVARASAVFHLAAQVAVTTSLSDPVHDFEVNVRGTLHVLEALRSLDKPPPLVFTSTNKVYGALSDVALRELGTRYAPLDAAIERSGIDEQRPLAFCSPYGCSKGAADQYVLDYAHSFQLPAVVFRMSCIYGPKQFGNEDQGWVAHFLIRAAQRLPVTVYGDGKQVRDVLFVSDLVDALLLAEQHIESLRGQAFNIGGGPGNVISLLELLEMAGAFGGAPLQVQYAASRVGDQPYYVSNHARFSGLTGWRPRVDVCSGVRMLNDWLLRYRVPSRSGARAVAADLGVLMSARGAST
jgi:CDP-paratose 2-epimerase